MKTYTPQQKIEAKTQLPKPVSDFLSSDDITRLYVGIFKKHQLPTGQARVISELANVTLLGLEPMSAFETNLHDAFPDFPSAVLRELSDDMNDRVFTEAQRRFRENIVTPEPEPADDIAVLTPEERASIPTDEELDRLVQEEEREERALADKILAVAAEPQPESAPFPEGPDDSTEKSVKSPEPRTEAQKARELADFLQGLARKDALLSEKGRGDRNSENEISSQTKQSVSIPPGPTGDGLTKQSGIINMPKRLPEDRDRIDPKQTP